MDNNVAHTEPIIENIRKDFPILKRLVNNRPLVYLDNAATTQKPLSVINALADYYSNYNANVHRGIHTLAEEATAAYEATRLAVKDFIHATSIEEIIFTRGTTESINLVAYTWAREYVQEGDEIVVSTMEHHSNIVPWQVICLEKKAILKVIPINEAGELDMQAYKLLLSPRTKLVSVVHVSNVLGTLNPVNEIIEQAHKYGAVVMIDAAQSIMHMDIDVQAMNCDFLAFSSHKCLGPTGVGILFGKKEILQSMPVFMSGGEMIKEVQFSGTTYNDLPYKYEAGTPNIADVVAFKESLSYINKIGKTFIQQHEASLLEYATAQLKKIEGIRLIGTAATKVTVVSFIVEGLHAQDIGVLLDNQGVAVRTGQHCAGPLMECLGIQGTIRASFSLYNTFGEVDILITALKKAIKMLS